jgi:glycine oxidase
LLVERDLQVNPRALALALQDGVRARGGTVVEGVGVEELEVDEGRVRSVKLIGPDGERRIRECETVVVAAGAWSTSGIRSPLERLGIHPLKGQLVRLRGPRLLRHVVRHPDVYLVPRESGELLIGASMEEVGFDGAPTAGAVHDLLRWAWQVVPGIYDLELAEISVVAVSLKKDNRPAIGSAGVEGLFAAVGHGRQGVLLAPATAHYLAEAIVSGSPPAELAPFAIDRFREDAEVFQS